MDIRFPARGACLLAARWIAALAGAGVLAGCTSMLPRGSSDTPSPFSSYEQARQAADRIVPFRTRASELRGLGFDPEEGRNVTVIPYPDIVARLAPHPGTDPGHLDPGIRACIQAQAACRGYLFQFRREDRTREGNFWVDFFNMRRTTHVTGWWFESMVVVSGDQVLFRNVGGEKHIDRVEQQRNPLGPLQGAGEAAGSLLSR